jgi:hypothetical protein
MACCGQRRAAPRRAEERTGPLVFELEGPGPLTVYGRATGMRYHFPGPSARLRVDPRDAPYLAATRGLRAAPDALSPGA